LLGDLEGHMHARLGNGLCLIGWKMAGPNHA